MMSNDMIQKATAQPAAKTDAKTSMQAYIKQMQGEIKKALPAVMTPERFTRIVLSALSTNPKLGQTTPQSFLAAMMTAAQLGMEPNTPLGQAYLIPFYNNIIVCGTPTRPCWQKKVLLRNTCSTDWGTRTFR